MTEQKTHSGPTNTLRQRAEKVFREKAAGPLGNMAVQTPEEIEKALHELRVHQIELEMQNEELRQAQTQLDISQTRYFDLYDLAPVGYFTLSETGLILEMNLTACSQLDKARGALIKQRFSSLILSDDQDIFFRHRKLLFETGAPQVYDLRLTKKDAAPFWVRIDSTLARDTDGMPICRATMIDITERKQAEAAQRENEANLRALLAASTQSVLLLDVHGAVIEINEIGAQRLGRCREEILGTNAYDHVPPEMVASRRARLAQVVSSGQPVRFEDYRAGRVLDQHLVPIFNEAGQVVRVAVFAEDITERRQMEEELRRSERLFRLDFEEAPVGRCLVGLDGRFLKANEAFCALQGRSASELGSRNILEVTHPEDHVATQEGLRQLLEGTLSRLDLEKRCLASDQRTVWASVRVGLFRDDAGAPLHFSFFVQDISERKQAEAALLEREEQLRSLASSIPGAIYQFVRRLDGVVEIPFMSEGGRLLFDRPLEELQNSSHLFDDVHPEDVPGLWASIEASAKDLTPWSTEFRLVPKTAPLRWLRGASSPHRMPDGGISWYGVLLDITDRMEAERRLRVELQRANSYLDTSATIMVALDNVGTIIMLNRYGLDLLGYEEKEIIGRNWFETALPQPKGMEQVYPVFRRIIGGDLESMRYFENEVITASGERRLIAWSNSNYLDDRGRITGTLSSGMDITDIKRAEVERENLQNQLRQAQKMESVGRLAGGVAHDFNNMLGVIFGHVEMAMEQIDPALPLYADLQGIQKAAERSSDLTSQLLAFARKQTVSPKVIDLNTTVEGMLKMLLRLIGEDIQLAWLPGVKLWPVRIDPSQIDQIMANLCVNARDAIAGVGNITIETANITLNEAYCADNTGFISGEYILITVGDDGCGMGKETLSHLFEPFFTTKETGKGTGLGLATVYGTVKQNDGFIDVDSEPDRGTTFKIYLPRYKGKAEQARTEGLQEQVMRGHETVLVVEDEKVLLDLSKRMLEKLGYQVVTVSTPGEAIHLAREYKGDIHLLLTDVIMPEMNGRDLAKSLLSLYPNMKRLFMSGYTADIIAHHGVLDDNVHFIQKPFSGKDLAAKVREALDRE